MCVIISSTSTRTCCFALFVCLTLLASFFHLSFENMYIQNLPHQFAVQYKARNNKDVIRDDIITALASLVTRNGDYSHTVDLSNPDLTVVVEIIKVTFNNLIIIYIHVYTHIYVSGTMHINVIQCYLEVRPKLTARVLHSYAGMRTRTGLFTMVTWKRFNYLL